MIYKGHTLDPFQAEAIDYINQGDSVLVAAPTGAGKTLIAEYAVEKCLAEGKRVVYTAPIKALSNQKFRDFTAIHGNRIGLKTGDVTINPDAQIILMTTEIFRNTIFESPEAFHDVAYAIFDEIHYLDDIERGTVWEESIIFAPENIRFLCLSATVPNLDQISKWIRQIRPEAKLHTVVEMNRPVPLKHFIVVPGLGVRYLDELKKSEEDRTAHQFYPKVDRERETHRWRAALIDHLAGEHRLPALFFAFNRRDCENFAGDVHRNLLNEEERARMLGLFDELCQRFAIEPDANVRHVRGLLGRGCAYHHAGLLPTLKEVIERVFTSGLLKILFATETFAVGVNMPARTVVFNTIHKFDGRRMGFLKTREHHQMSGRAGRRGIDPVGYVYSVAEWPHVRAGIIERVIHGEIEPIRSQFNLSYSTLLTLWEHLGDKIYTAAERSFSNFSGAKRKKTSPHAFANKIAQMKKKLTVLRNLGYIGKDRSLTPKGQFARQIQGYELQVTELLFKRHLEHLSEDELNIVFSGIVYESKKSDWHRPPQGDRLKWVRKQAYKIVDEILRQEDSLDIEDRTKELDFRFLSAVQAWSRGCEWRDLEAHTSASDGDMVRYFRLTIQLLRNTLYALDRDDPLRAKLRRCVEKMNRDVVDAERQLRMGTEEPPAGTKPEEGPFGFAQEEPPTM